MRTGRFVAVVGSGAAGLAAAHRLNHAGHFVTVFERARQLGGRLRTSPPGVRPDEAALDGHLARLASNGVVLRARLAIGVDLAAEWLADDYDAIVLTAGAVNAESAALLAAFNVGRLPNGDVWCDEQWMTSTRRIFAAGGIRARDATIARSIADGRQAARAVDLYLMGTSDLPAVD